MGYGIVLFGISICLIFFLFTVNCDCLLFFASTPWLPDRQALSMTIFSSCYYIQATF